MATKPKTHPEDAAKAVFRMTTRKPQDVVVQTNQLLENVKKHPQYPTTPAMQQAVTTVSGITDTLATQDTNIQTARTGLVALMAARALTMHSFMRARRSLLAVADQIAAGSAATLNEWGFTASTSNAPLPATDTPPTALRVRYTKTLVMEIVWKAVAGQRGYVLQIGDGTPQGWGPVIQCPKARYLPTGLNPGQKIAIRVAVQRKSGLSTWSESISATVR